MQTQELQIINEQTVLGKDFKIYGTAEDPLFLAKDVADWIEHKDVTSMLRSIDEDEKQKINTRSLSGGLQANTDYWFLTEDGLYEVLMQSRKPIAKQFKSEVKKILKSIRTTGGYIVNQEEMSPEELLAKALQVANNVIAKKAEENKKLLAQNQELVLESKAKDQVINELKPKLTYLDEILGSKNLLNITQIAKDYGMSGQELNRKLSEMRIQYKQRDQWLLYSSYQREEYTMSETTCYKDSTGVLQTRLSTKWTQKGRLFLYEKLKKEGILPMIERD